MSRKREVRERVDEEGSRTSEEVRDVVPLG